MCRLITKMCRLITKMCRLITKMCRLIGDVRRCSRKNAFNAKKSEPLCEFFDGSAAHLGKMGSTQRKVNHSVNFSTGSPLAKASDFQQSQDDCLTTISRVAFSDPGFCDFPGAPALKKSLAICFVQGVDFREIPMESEPLLSTFRPVRRYPGVAVFSKARLIVWP